MTPQTTETQATPTVGDTAECRHCNKGIRRDRQAYWGARKRDDPYPWYCDASPDAEKRHVPDHEPEEG